MSFEQAIKVLSEGDRRRTRSPDTCINEAAARRELIDVADCYRENKKAWSSSVAERRALYEDALGQAITLEHSLAKFAADAFLRAPLLASDAPFKGTPWNWRSLSRTVAQLRERLTPATQHASGAVHRGRAQDPSMHNLIAMLANVYEKHTGRRAGRSNHTNGSGPAHGPFVRFVEAVYGELEPELATTRQLSATISKVLQKRNRRQSQTGT